MVLLLALVAFAGNFLTWAYHDRTTLQTIPPAKTLATSPQPPSSVVEALIASPESPLYGGRLVERTGEARVFAPTETGEACAAAHRAWYAAVDDAYAAEKWGKAMKLRDAPEPFFAAEGVAPTCATIDSTVAIESLGFEGASLVVEVGNTPTALSWSRVEVWAYRLKGDPTTLVHVHAEPWVAEFSGMARLELPPRPKRLIAFDRRGEVDGRREEELVAKVVGWIGPLWP